MYLCEIFTWMYLCEIYLDVFVEIYLDVLV